MALTNSVSVKEVIARIIRNTRLTDTSYIIDMYEWIPEAMYMMRTPMSFTKRYADLKVDFHKTKLPLWCKEVLAVEFQGYRLHKGDDTRALVIAQTPVNNPYNNFQINNPGFTSVETDLTYPNGDQGTSSGILLEGYNPQLSGKPEVNTINNATPFYQVEMGYITTSFKNGWIRVHCHTWALDDDGFPLVPDNENYKEALYYYVLHKMFGAGYTNAIYNTPQAVSGAIQMCQQMWDMYMRRAVNEIFYPSPDEMETITNNTIRLIPVRDYYENYFSSNLPEGQYGFIDTIFQRRQNLYGYNDNGSDQGIQGLTPLPQGNQ